MFHGGGGDNLFCSLQSPAPAADRFLAAGPDRRFWATASGIATLAQVSVLRVVQKAIQRAATRRRAYRARGDHSLLSDHAIEAAAEALDHPWLTANERGLPGLAAHIGLIVAAQSVAESANMCAAPLWKSSLISQPIVEACVSLPSWVWYDRGCNRAAARHAFANALPAQVAWRRSKGAMSSFIVELFEANRPILYDLLIDGALANHGMIDRNAVAAILRNPSVTRGEAYGRVMRLADVETWIRSWRG